MRINITEGYLYQTIDGMTEVTDKSFSDYLIYKAANSHCEVLSKDEAINKGFIELAKWSTPDDRLLFIDDNFLLCCRECDLKA